MNPELNREYPDPDEAKLIEEMVKVALERMRSQDGRIRRGQLVGNGRTWAEVSLP